MTESTTSLADAPARLLAWYDAHRRVLPWRAPPGVRPDPYCVWLSEVMLQQTTVAAATPYFEAFLRRWPAVEDLAAADIDAVMAAWAGLGYYARARNMHKCARIVAESGGRFPRDVGALKALPGIGDYMAAAIAAIAFDVPATVVDGNVERVIARVFSVEDPLPGAKPAIRAAAARLTPDRRPGDYAQALMDLGATVCTPRSPRCSACPWADRCAARAAGKAADLPRRAPRKPKPVRHVVAFRLEARDPETGAPLILLRRRPAEGLLGGMLELPATPWRPDEAWRDGEALAHAPVDAAWTQIPGEARHTFTHFHLRARVWRAEIAFDAGPADGEFRRLEDLAGAAVPTAVRKMIDL